MKRGAPAGALKILTETDLHRIHAAALSLLGETGVLSQSDVILDLFHKNGARVDRSSRVIRVPADMVEAALKSAPKSFILYGRDPEQDLLIESGRVYYGLGGTSEPFFWDSQLGRARHPTKADMVAVTRVGQALPHIDFVMTLCSSGDMPPDQVFIHDYDAIFRNTTKPVVFSVLGRRSTATLIEMAAAACGGEREMRRRPWGMAIASSVSPLVVTPFNEGIIDAVEWGVPIRYGVGPMMGGTSPATVAGTVAQSLAEVLFGLVMVQLIKSGAPFVLAPNTNVMDMVTGQCTYSSPEQALGKMAVAQLGRFYQLPTWATGGGVESKLPDGEAVAQAMMTMLLTGLAGITLNQNLGTLASGMYGSAEMAVICDELAHMVKRVVAGFAVTDDTLAVDVVQEVGHGRTFMTHEHTLSHFKQELFFPVLFRRQTTDQWLEGGAKPIVDVAHQRVQDILAQAGPMPLPPGAHEALERIVRQVTV
jgi:trimethylamine--corrinoid protein Co-methyltransferase